MTTTTAQAPPDAHLADGARRFFFKKVVLLKQYAHTFNSCIVTYQNGVDKNVPVKK